MAPMKRMLNSLNPMKSHGGVKEKSGESKEKSAENKEKNAENKEKNAENKEKNAESNESKDKSSETSTADVKEGETTSPPSVEDKHNSQEEKPSV